MTFKKENTQIYCYRNLKITYKPKAGGFDLFFEFANSSSIGRRYIGLPDLIKHEIYVTRGGENRFKIVDFIGAPKSAGFGRLCANALFSIMKEIYGPDAIAYGHLANPNGNERDHLRRLAFWRSCGFEIENPDCEYSNMEAKVSDLVIRHTYNDSTHDAYGIPYVININEFSSNGDNRLRDKHDLMTFPINDVEEELNRAPQYGEIALWDLKAEKYRNYLNMLLPLVFFIGSGVLFNNVEMLKPSFFYGLFAGPILGFFAARFIGRAFFSVNPYKLKKQIHLNNISKIIHNWCKLYPTSVSFMEGMLNSDRPVKSIFARDELPHNDAICIYERFKKLNINCF